ncbi:lytic transglycosylase domain-containing protein [Litorisediminicola beolgyonensis]|uniref:Lytic transglycosylase domain-containing protein n=1 Tax=Litorisediminicola beolgyonensis TaxID=1173614 RepID=A0ABW3ZH04_9RHOB
MRRLARACALVLGLMPLPAAAAGWADFYGTATAPSAAPGGGVTGMCLRQILAAQERYAIPHNLLLAIGLQEAGMMRDGELTVWPWAVNSEGKGHIFDSRSGALAFVASEHRRGARSIDVGCMQINLRWHPKAFDSVTDGFDPVQNVDYAARFLKGLYHEIGDWEKAAGAYHSRTEEHQRVYRTSLERNIRVANDRIAIFRDVARNAPETAPVAQAGGPFWSTRSEPGAPRRSLFGSGDLQPILPVFVRGERP